MENEKKFRFDYSWVIIAICFLMVFACLGLCSSGRTYYLTAITDALSIPRGLFSINDTIRFVTTSIVNLFFGKLISRFGTKKLILAGIICLMIFSVINANAEKLYAFYIGGVFLGLGLSWTTTTMISSVINKWATKNKATLTGAVLAANGIGGAIAVQIIVPIIFQEGNPFGYRESYFMVSKILLVLFLLVLILFRDKPVEAGEQIGKKKKKARGTGWIGMEYEEIVKKPYFYVTLLCVFFTGMVLQGLGGMAVPHMLDVGLDAKVVAAVSSFGGILLTGTKFLAGFMYDRFGMRIVMNVSLASAFVAIFGLVMIDNSVFGIVWAYIRSIFSCIALPLETVMLSIYVTEFFGNKAFDRIIGIIVSVSTAGFAIGAPFANICFDISGSYNIAFIIFAILMVIVTVAMMYVLKASGRDKKIILEREEEKTLSNI